MDAPSGRHGNATGFAFADGHYEIHKRQDSNVTPTKLNLFNDISFLGNAGVISAARDTKDVNDVETVQVRRVEHHDALVTGGFVVVGALIVNFGES